jgi:hypothetical protein
VNKCIVRKIVLFVSLLLLVGGQAWCDDTCTKPCWNLSTNCGGIEFLENTCPGSYETGCDGSCSRKCAAGGKNEFCASLFSTDCCIGWSKCSAIKTYRCIQVVGGACICEEVGSTGDFCYRRYCKKCPED